MIPDRSYFYNYLNNLKSDVNAYDNLITSVENNTLNPNEIIEISDGLDQKITKDLNEINWMVEILDKDVHQDLIDLAMKSLIALGRQLGNLQVALKYSAIFQVSPEVKVKLEEECLKINSIYQGQLKEVFEKTDKKINRIKMETLKFPKESEVKGLEIEISKAQAAKPEASTKSSSSLMKIMSFFSKEPLIEGSNNIPKPISYYIEEFFFDDPNRIQNVMEHMKGVNINTVPSVFNQSSEILSENKESIKVPGAFASDILRQERLVINGKTMLDTNLNGSVEGDPNEAARTLYMLFGKEGAERLMLVCQQSISFYIIENFLSPKIFGETVDGKYEPGEYAKAYPNEILLPSAEGGLSFYIDMDYANELVSIKIKYLAKIHVKTSDFTAHIPVKMSITIPYKNLTNDTFKEEDWNSHNIHTEDVIGIVIKNDINLAKEVLEKL